MSVFRHPAAALGNSGLRNWFGDGSDGDIRLTVADGAEQSFDGVLWSPMPGWTNTAGLITVPSVQDGDMVVVNARNLTVEAGVTLTTAHRCRGLLLYATGSVIINGTVSMTARGCRANPADSTVTANTPVAPSDGLPVPISGLRIAKFAPGTASGASDLSGCGMAARNAEANQPIVQVGLVVDIPRAGGPGGPAQAGVLSGVAGQTAPGGSGGGGSGASAGGASGSGAAGTCWSGGPGGGGNGRGSGTVSYVNAAPYGGSGGKGYDGTEDSGGGAGNPGGQSYLSNSARAGQDGTGGLLIIIARTIAGTGTFSSCGMNGGSAPDRGGGASGGGIILLLSVSFAAWSGSADVSGGVGGSGIGGTTGGDGGNGSVIQHSIF